MSSGIQSWHDEMAEEQKQIDMKRFKAHQSEHFTAVTETKNALDRFVSSDPALTKVQWAYINERIALLKKITA